MLRRLGTFERALFISDQHSPFNVVSVLRLGNSPAPEIVRSALEGIQARHLFLQAGIRDGYFERISSPRVPFNVIEKHISWLELVKQEMNTRLDTAQGLFRGSYIYTFQHADLILTFHHAIMDAASGMNLLDELMQLCANKLSAPHSPLEVVPPVEKQFPRLHKGLTGFLRTMKYAFAQMGDEFLFQWNNRRKETRTVQLGGHGFPMTLTLPESLVDAISKRCRAEKLTLNSLLNASLLLATNRYLYNGLLTPMRTFTFADLRPYTIPPTNAKHLANYISMLRFTMNVSGHTSVWDLAKQLHSKIYDALKKGDKFSSALMSESLMKMFTTMKSMRMGASALNYSGAVQLSANYGNIKVTELHAFLSSYDLGPEVSCQARLFNDQLWLDFMFLETDMDSVMAEKIVGEVKAILEEAGSS
jgi:NRPS condensation-like uncharacterized protein